MLRITTTHSEGSVVTIDIAGRLTPDGCEAVEQLLQHARDHHQQARVDLANVRLVDQPSVEYLAHVRRRHVELINVPSYIDRWIEQVSNQPGSSGNMRGRLEKR
jgi:hypothetical protein